MSVRKNEAGSFPDGGAIEAAVAVLARKAKAAAFPGGGKIRGDQGTAC